MKQSYVIMSLAVLAVVAALGGYLWLRQANSSQKVIAIVTTLSHPALDDVRLGFKSQEDPGIKFLEFNAEGNMQSANAIARHIVQNPNIIGILAIGTLAAQTLAKVEKNRPIVIAAVSDPEAIVPDHEASNVCGLTDAIDADYQLNTILELLPHTKSISLLYSPHEANSASMVKKLNAAAVLKKLGVVLVGVHEPQQIANASLRACQKGDLVLIPLDNQLVAAMPSVIKATKNQPCPIITSNESPIHQGATIAFGVDYKKSGERARIIMGEILSHQKSPQDIGFIDPTDRGLFINKRVSKEKALNLNAPSEAIIIDGE